MDLDLLSLSTFAPKVAFCMVAVLMSQVHWRLHTDDVGFPCNLIWYHAHLPQNEEHRQGLVDWYIHKNIN